MCYEKAAAMVYGDMPPLITDRQSIPEEDCRAQSGLAKLRCGAQPGRGSTVLGRPAGWGRRRQAGRC
jgi:hypothetical protein